MKLSSKVKVGVMALVLAMMGASAPIMSVYAYTCPDGSSAPNAAQCGMNATNTSDTQPKPLEDTVTNIINAILYVVGVLAVVMVIIGGVKYTTSGGDQAAVTSAKNTILYGVVGLIIAILAYAIVNFVVKNVAADEYVYGVIFRELIG
ncbi:hypothetical protein IKG06_01825 [Candidatus Saccharibacteria bacterium]|nr:hypothetical protein [Candidatus Saccharibacteria bacterium]